MRRSIQLTLLVSGSLLASGCQMFHSNSARLQAGLHIKTQLEPHAYAQAQFEVGRGALASGNHATAAIAFRNSALEPDFAARSHNGLAIAYAGMGRNDLAEQYFNLAIAEDPANAQFSNNLLRLQRANFASEQARQARAELAARPAQPEQPQILRGTEQRASLAVSSPTNRVGGPTANGVFVGGGAINKGSHNTLKVRVPHSHNALPTIVVGQPRLQGTDPAVAIDGPRSPASNRRGPDQPETSLEVQRQPRRTVTFVVRTNEPKPERAHIQTTGRRYSDQQFAEIFAPYSNNSERGPILGAVSSPGLRSDGLAAPIAARAVSADSNLAVADK